MPRTDRTHDPRARSWVASAHAPGCDFPLQNLPHGAFREAGGKDPYRGGIAIGDQVLDVGAALRKGLFAPPVGAAARAAATAPLNDLMGLPRPQRVALRDAVWALLAEGAQRPSDTAACLVPMDRVVLGMPAQVGNFSDFYCSLHHATNVGRMLRPDNPILPNYKWLPVAYGGRVSSIRVSGVDVVRPCGQVKDAADAQPRYAPCRRLDYEVELGIFAGPGNELGSPIAAADAAEHVFGMCLLNDWSARDLQAWEYQPLGPFLAKSFFTSVSPWVVTMEALEPFRKPFARPDGDPPPLPHLWHAELAHRGAIDVRVRLLLQTSRMRDAGEAPVAITTSRYTDTYWALDQLVAHQTSNGANLCPGDLLGSGTISGTAPDSRACLLELTEGGKSRVTLPNGETRAFLEDGDRVVMQGWCEAPGQARIGFGECSATVLPARMPA